MDKSFHDAISDAKRELAIAEYTLEQHNKLKIYREQQHQAEIAVKNASFVIGTTEHDDSWDGGYGRKWTTYWGRVNGKFYFDLKQEDFIELQKSGIPVIN